MLPPHLTWVFTPKSHALLKALLRREMWEWVQSFRVDKTSIQKPLPDRHSLSDPLLREVLQQIPVLWCRTRSAKPSTAPARLPAMENPHCGAEAAWQRHLGKLIQASLHPTGSAAPKGNLACPSWEFSPSFHTRSQHSNSAQHSNLLPSRRSFQPKRPSWMSFCLLLLQDGGEMTESVSHLPGKPQSQVNHYIFGLNTL